jgi:hypothetical protein
MANKIEIFENTLLKLLVRRGMDVDRQNIVLTEGEIGYTTDTKRLYVGDGQTKGGILIGGNKFLGSVPNVTTLFLATSGDLAYSTSTSKLYAYSGGDYSNINNWAVVGGTYNNQNSTISINATNGIAVGTISASNITSDIAGPSLTLSTSNKLTLSSDIVVDKIRGLNSAYINLPSTLRINSISYQWPEGGVPNNSYLQSDISGNLTWTPYINTETTNFVYTSSGIIPVGSIMPFISSANAPSGWLLCNGQSVAGSVYPELSAVIGITFGGNTTNFNVPNLINKTLYGVNNSPGTSTLYSVSSGTNSALSATGALYIIKARPDGVTNVSMSVSTPLCAAVNGTQTTGYFNPLSGRIDLGLTAPLTATTTVLGGFVADTFGRVTGQVTTPAGTTNTPGPGTRPVYNGTSSPIGFFQTPAYILNQGYTTASTSYRFTISAYPFITDNTGAKVGGGTFYSVPSNAKNLIVDSSIYKRGPDTGNLLRILASAPNISLVEATSLQTLGVNEFLIGASRADGAGDSIQGSTQCMIPLSATNTGDLVAAFRASASVNDSYWIRVVGYTL